MSPGQVLRTGGMDAGMLAAEGRHLRTLARLVRGQHDESAWDGWGVAEVVSIREVQPRALQVGETVLIAPHGSSDPTVTVHSKIRGEDIRVPRSCVHVALPPTR